MRSALRDHTNHTHKLFNFNFVIGADGNPFGLAGALCVHWCGRLYAYIKRITGCEP